MAAPSPSVRVAQAQISIMLLASAAITAYARDLKEKGYIAHLSRFITLVLCGAYLVPGSVHRFKEDSGMLSIAQGKGWAFTGPIPAEKLPAVMFSKMWGKGQILVGVLLAYIELFVPQQSAAVMGLHAVSAFHDLLSPIATASGGSGGLNLSKAPGRYRARGVAAISVLSFLLAWMRGSRR